MVPAPQVLFLYADPAAGGEAPRGPVATPDTLVPTRPAAASPDAAAPDGTSPPPIPPLPTMEPGGEGTAPPQPVAQG